LGDGRREAIYIEDKKGIVVKEAILKCSHDSKFIAIFMHEVNTLKIFKINEKKDD
jgi:hypothetical protein